MAARKAASSATPKTLPAHTARELNDVDHFVTLDLDAGVYRWITEIIQSKQLQSRTRGIISPWYPDLIERAMRQFGINQEAPPPMRRVVRRAKK
jgi:hypothetical protein